VFVPSDADGFIAAVIGLQVDLIMLTDAMLFFFQTVSGVNYPGRIDDNYPGRF
jgi:hypothetical protein